MRSAEGLKNYEKNRALNNLEDKSLWSQQTDTWFSRRQGWIGQQKDKCFSEGNIHIRHDWKNLQVEG